MNIQPESDRERQEEEEEEDYTVIYSSTVLCLERGIAGHDVHVPFKFMQCGHSCRPGKLCFVDILVHFINHLIN